MKITKPAYLTFLMAATFMLALSSCTRQSGPAPEAAKEHGATADATATAFEDYCTDCHEGARALGREMDLDEWRAVTRRMSGFRFEERGEGIPEDIQEEIVDYLMKPSR